MEKVKIYSVSNCGLEREEIDFLYLWFSFDNRMKICSGVCYFIKKLCEMWYWFWFMYMLYVIICRMVDM